MKRLIVREYYTHSRGVIEISDHEEVIGVLKTRSISTPLQIITVEEE